MSPSRAGVARFLSWLFCCSVSVVIKAVILLALLGVALAVSAPLKILLLPPLPLAATVVAEHGCQLGKRGNERGRWAEQEAPVQSSFPGR